MRSFFVKNYSGENIETRIYTRYIIIDYEENLDFNLLNNIDIPFSIELNKIVFDNN